MPPKTYNPQDEAAWRESYGKAIRMLSREEGWALQDAMVRGMMREEFQAKLHAAWDAAAGNNARQQQARRDVCMEVQGPVLERFGFPASFAGLMECYLAFGEDLKTDTEILVQNSHLNWLANPGIQAEHPVGAAGEIRLVHFPNGAEEELARLPVDPADDVQKLKGQIAVSSGVPEGAQQLWLVTGAEGSFRELQDADLLSSVLPLGGTSTIILGRRRAEVVEWLTKISAEQDKKRKLQVVAEVDDELLEDAELMLPVVQQCGKALSYAGEAIQANREVVLAAVHQEGASLQYAAAALRSDPEVVWTAIESDPWALEFAAPELRACREIVLMAVREDGWVLTQAAPELQADREVVTAAVLQNCEVLEEAPAELRADSSLVLSAVRVDGNALMFAAPELQANYEVVLAAVRTTGEALKHACFELQEAPEIVWAAVSQSWQVLGLLHEGTQTLDIAMLAVRQDVCALQFVEKALKAKVMEVLGVKAQEGARPLPNIQVQTKRSDRLQRHFATLGLDERTAPEAIRKRYRQLALEHHPDKHPEDVDGAKRRFQLINTAYRAIREQLGF